MIVDPLYLSAYPIGHLIDFQLEQYLKGKKIGPEVERIFAMGHLTPDLWLQRAVGQKLSTTPLLNATSNAVIDVANYDKQIKKERKETKVIKKKKSK